MLKDKVLKVLSTIFECMGIGGLLLYFYNYFTLRGKYDVIPAEIKANLNTYLLIGISGGLLFVIFKILQYFTRPKKDTEYEQTKMHLEEETPKNFNETYNNNYNYDYNNKEIKEFKVEPNYMYEQKTTHEEPKYVYENKYTVPVEKQTTCPNCGNVVDKNATICLYCGFLLQSFETRKDKFDEQRFIIQSFKKLEDKFSELFMKIDNKLDSLNVSSNISTNINTSANVKQEEKYEQPYVQPYGQPYEQPYEKSYESQPYNPQYYYEEPAKQNKSSKDQFFLVKYYMNKFLPVIAIILLIIVGGYMLFNSISKKDNTSEIGEKENFYGFANNIISEVESMYNNHSIVLEKNTKYYTLSDLNYISTDYNSNKSYVAINASDRNNIKYYISLVGNGIYGVYSINITEKNDLDVTDVAMNTPTVSEIDGKLLIDSGNSVTIYYKD